MRKSKMADHSCSNPATFIIVPICTYFYLYLLLLMYLLFLKCTYLYLLLLVRTFTKLLDILNVLASANQATFLLYSVALMKNMKNLINFLLRLQQSKQKIYEIIALFTQFCEV